MTEFRIVFAVCVTANEQIGIIMQKASVMGEFKYRSRSKAV